MEISEREMETLNFYRASALHGGLILGRTVARARDPQLILELTRHSAEEVLHAQLWTEAIVALGGTPTPVRSTYQRRLATLLGKPSTMLQILAATQVFERRAYRHFLDHLRRPGTHRRVQTTLHRMIDEEKYHLAWVKEWLDRQAEIRGDLVEQLLDRYTNVDTEVYEALLDEDGWVQAA